MFENATHEVRLSEGSSPGSKVYHAKATDKDAGLNGDLTYNFTKDTWIESGRTFGINTDTGLVYTKGDLDYELRTEYMLYIVASDKGLLFSTIF